MCFWVLIWFNCSSLTEKIVVVLPKMKCPFQLEPHQIQGLDFINIFPVVEWLVKRSAENRSEKADRLKKLAASQFQNYFTLGSDREAKQVHARQLGNLKTVEDRYIPKRQFRRTERGPDDVMSRVRITLMEYGTRDFSVKTNVDIAEIDADAQDEDVFRGMLQKTDQEEVPACMTVCVAVSLNLLFDLIFSLILISYSKTYQLLKR